MKAHINIKLYASLDKYLPQEPEKYAIASGTTILSVIEKLEIPMDQAKLIFLNGARADLKTPLNDGDRLGIFPPVGGG